MAVWRACGEHVRERVESLQMEVRRACEWRSGERVSGGVESV